MYQNLDDIPKKKPSKINRIALFLAALSAEEVPVFSMSAAPPLGFGFLVFLRARAFDKLCIQNSCIEGSWIMEGHILCWGRRESLRWTLGENRKT